MKHTKQIVVVAVLLLAVAGEPEGQSAYEHASLEAHRWEVYAAGDAVKRARELLDSARYHRTSVEPKIKKARNKVMQEKDKAERGNRDSDDLAKSEARLFFVEKHYSVIEARIVAAQSYLSVSEARIVSAEAVVVAAEAASKEAVSTALTAYNAVLEAYLTAFRGLADIIKIDKGVPSKTMITIDLPSSHSPSAGEVSTAWRIAAQAARAAKRAEAIVEALNSGGEVPQELLEPLPTEFGSVA